MEQQSISISKAGIITTLKVHMLLAHRPRFVVAFFAIFAIFLFLPKSLLHSSLPLSTVSRRLCAP
jgi:hypothetical protein